MVEMQTQVGLSLLSNTSTLPDRLSSAAHMVSRCCGLKNGLSEKAGAGAYVYLYILY